MLKLKLKQFIFLIFFTALMVILAAIAWQATPALSNSESSSDMRWQPVGEAAPAELVKQLNQDYAPHLRSNMPVKITDTLSMKMLKLQQPDSLPLYLINTRVSPPGHPELTPSCSIGGCLFLGYVPDREQPKQFKQVLNGWINDFRLQNSPPVIQAVQQTMNQIPCFRLTDFNQINQKMDAPIVLCSNGEDFVPAGK